MRTGPLTPRRGIRDRLALLVSLTITQGRYEYPVGLIGAVAIPVALSTVVLVVALVAIYGP